MMEVPRRTETGAGPGEQDETKSLAGVALFDAGRTSAVATGPETVATVHEWSWSVPR